MVLCTPKWRPRFAFNELCLLLDGPICASPWPTVRSSERTKAVTAPPIRRLPINQPPQVSRIGSEDFQSALSQRSHLHDSFLTCHFLRRNAVIAGWVSLLGCSQCFMHTSQS